MSQVQIHLASGGIIDDMLDLIADLIAELNDQQEAADAFHAECRATCNQLLPEYSTKRDYHED
ncbi:MAG: hypothetical protein GY861_25180 [bacterium]|nr:hypothetical protein [bacterium]